MTKVSINLKRQTSGLNSAVAYPVAIMTCFATIRPRGVVTAIDVGDLVTRCTGECSKIFVPFA